MLVLQAEELRSQGKFSPKAKEFVFLGQRLLLSESFPKHWRAKVIKLCQEELDANRFCLVVESPTDLTIWRLQSELVGEVLNSVPSVPPETAAPSPINPGLFGVFKRIMGFSS